MIFIVIVVAGSVLDASLVIDLSDTFNGLMAIPNLIGVLSLSGTVLAITNNYAKRIFKGDKSVKPMLSFFKDIQKEQEQRMRND